MSSDKSVSFFFKKNPGIETLLSMIVMFCNNPKHKPDTPSWAGPMRSVEVVKADASFREAEI